MTKELITAAAGVSTIVSNIVTTYAEMKIVRQEKMVQLKAQIKKCNAIAISNSKAEVVMNNINNIAKVQKCIDDNHFTGATQEMAMKQLYALNNSLIELLKVFD